MGSSANRSTASMPLGNCKSMNNCASWTTCLLRNSLSSSARVALAAPCVRVANLRDILRSFSCVIVGWVVG
eukprot:1283612-Amphidinium_carterae.5